MTDQAYLAGATLVRKIESNEKQRIQALEALRSGSNDTLEFTDLKEQAIGIDLTKIIQHPHSAYDLTLMEGDRLQIPQQLQTVRLSGALFYPSR